VLTFVKRLLIGRPLASSELEHQRLPKRIALSTFSSDAISSTAYATEEILFVIAVGGSSLALGLSKLVPISMAVAVLLAIVVFSYRQTIFAYPNGGGSYIVSRENLGETPSLVAGASLLVDYILTVAVSISSGVAAIISIPALRGLADQRVLLCLLMVGLVTMANLRGVKESGKLFAYPTYTYIIALSVMLVIGLWRSLFGDIDPVPFDPEQAEDIALAGGNLSLFLLLKGFSSGAVALTGVEAISDGVPAFREPASKNAAATLVTMAVILGTLFFGTAVLAHHLEPYPSHDETVMSQLAHVVFGGGIFYWVLQFATVGILVLAANTAYADFPRLSSIIANDGFLPRQFANRGDRLVFSNGVVFLGVAASILIIAFGGITTALIPLYAIGVFTSFTISQAGMYSLQRKRGATWKAAISGVGATATFIVALVVATTKFTDGAYLPIFVVPAIIWMFKSIKRHYATIGDALHIEPGDVPLQPDRHTFVVLVSRVHRGVIEAINYARSLRPDHIAALHISDGAADHAAIHEEWERFGFDVPLDIVDSPYRELVEPVEAYLDALDRRWSTDRITVVIPEFVVGVRSLSNVLHGQAALGLKLALLDRPNTIVTSVPFHVAEGHPPADADLPTTAEPAMPKDRERPAVTAAADRAPRRPGLTASTEELERARLAKRFGGVQGSTAIMEATERQPMRVAGEITASRVVPRAGSPSLEITVSDGSGAVVAVYTGRRRILGLDPGRGVVLEGVARRENDQLVLVNPAYTLLS
jgi:amino acid transporter